ncbi:MAG: hypothetical protein ACYSU1_06545 [Planctomycetota bacterium]
MTGGASGIGLAIARVLAASSARVAVGARRLAEPAAVQAAIAAIGPGTCQSRSKKGQCTGGIVANGPGLASALARVPPHS